MFCILVTSGIAMQWAFAGDAPVTNENDPNFVGPPSQAQNVDFNTNTISPTSSILGISDKDLRDGNVDMNSIPVVLASVIQFIIGIAGTVAIFMLIFFAVKMQISSMQLGDTSGVEKSKKGMISAGIGFLLAISAWFIMARVIDILSTATGANP